MFIKQHDITDCGAACLAAIAAYYKLTLSVAKIRQYASTGEKGTTLLGLIEAATKMGFEAKGVKGTQKSLGKIPLPAIAHLVIEEAIQHYVVIYKVSTRSIRIMDPKDGKMHRKEIEEFNNEWTGVLLLLLPNEQFKIGNQKTTNSLRFWQLIKPHQHVVLQALFGSLIYTILGLCTAIFVQKITDYVLADGNRNLLNLMSMIMIAVLLIQLLVGTIKNLFTMRTGQQIDASLILGYHRHLLRLPQQFFDTMRLGEIISRVNDAVKIRAFINDISISLVLNTFIILFSFALMFTYYWKLASLILMIIPLYVLIYAIGNTVNKKNQRRLMEESAELESQLIESLNTVGTIKRFGLEEFIDLKIETRFIKMLRTLYNSGKVVIFSNSAVELISRLFVVVLLWIGSGYVLDNEITPGELFSFYALIGYFTGPAASLINANKAILDARIAADRLFEIMDLEIEDDSSKIALTPNLIGDICFENISFRYGNKVNIFDNLSVSIKAGSFTAIVGESGSGKSTLIALLQNIYPIQEGSILIGQYSIKYFSTASIRKLLSVVPQKVDLFAGSVIDNIAVGDSEPSMQRVVDVCTQLGIIKFIETLPKGFQTYLGENGATLSGGQKQRIAIARALYRSPEILILDEATSSLDTAAEHDVQRTIDLLTKQHKTIIMIAHRLTTIRHANHIVVLDKGKIIEEGTHHEMIAAEGHYYALWQQQFADINF
ncbi:MAG TPA: peptidase domain-containing ABC transporter [Pedobacter sp.]|nr:peptidase domain-containing ABC transporter [Pedobacter sp.]